jgi:hypothetical protein
MATQPTPIPPSHVLRARRIELVDEEGNIKMTLDGRRHLVFFASGAKTVV